MWSLCETDRQCSKDYDVSGHSSYLLTETVAFTSFMCWAGKQKTFQKKKAVRGNTTWEKKPKTHHTERHRECLDGSGVRATDLWAREKSEASNEPFVFCLNHSWGGGYLWWGCWWCVCVCVCQWHLRGGREKYLFCLSDNSSWSIFSDVWVKTF